MRYLLFVILAVVARAQSPGSFTRTTVNTIAATAGALTCTFANQVPASPAGTHVECIAGSTSLKQDSVLAPTPASGQVGSFHSGPDAITWVFTLSTSGIVNFQLAANGQINSGTF